MARRCATLFLIPRPTSVGRCRTAGELFFFTFTYVVPASNTGQAFQRRFFMTNETHEINLDEALRTIGPDAAAIFDNASGEPTKYSSSETLYAALDDEDEEEEDDDYEDEDEEE